MRELQKYYALNLSSTDGALRRPIYLASEADAHIAALNQRAETAERNEALTTEMMRCMFGMVGADSHETFAARCEELNVTEVQNENLQSERDGACIRIMVLEQQAQASGEASVEQQERRTE